MTDNAEKLFGPYKDLIESKMVPYIGITPGAQQELPLWASKFGGAPYMPKGVEWPKTDKKKNLNLLAQLNFAEIPHLDPFPQKGILQFWIYDAFGYGETHNKLPKDTFRTVYYPDVATTDLQNSFGTKLKWKKGKSDLFDTESDTPSFAMSFQQDMMPPQARDYRTYDFVHSICEELMEKHGLGEDDVYEDWWELYYIPVMPHRIGGYAFFTQDDLRHKEKYADKNILLLQIESQNGFVSWDDNGVANFFINEAKLKALDFSEVMYTWDCH